MSKSPDDEIYELGVVDGYAKAMQEVDVRTGGGGEYRFAMGGPSDRHCPDAEAMRDRIAARFDGQLATFKFVAPGLLVLRNMCARAGLKLGAAKVQEMINAVRCALCDEAPEQEHDAEQSA